VRKEAKEISFKLELKAFDLLLDLKEISRVKRSQKTWKKAVRKKITSVKIQSDARQGKNPRDRRMKIKNRNRSTTTTGRRGKKKRDDVEEE